MVDKTRSSRRWLITGVSSGLGEALAQAALERGDSVIGTLRQERQLAGFAALAPGRAFPLRLDVTDDAAAGPTLERAIREMGGVDILVNNAGYALIGAVEDVSVAEARIQIETNFFGVLKMVQAVMPHLR